MKEANSEAKSSGEYKDGNGVCPSEKSRLVIALYLIVIVKKCSINPLLSVTLTPYVAIFTALLYKC
jgi:hypothetical protein